MPPPDSTSGSPTTDAHSGARSLGRASRVSTGLALLPLVGLGAACTPRLVFAPLGEDFWASAYPHAPRAWVPGSRHTCSPFMEQRCHLNPLHPSFEVTHCLSQQSPHLKVVLPSPGLRGCWSLDGGGVIPQSALQGSSSYSRLISCIRESISALPATKCCPFSCSISET